MPEEQNQAEWNRHRTEPWQVDPLIVMESSILLSYTAGEIGGGLISSSDSRVKIRLCAIVQVSLQVWRACGRQFLSKAPGIQQRPA